jgi:putative transposase
MLIIRFRKHLSKWLKPKSNGLLINAVADLTRSKADLIFENALLRQQLIILRRSVKRPQLKRRDRWLIIFLANRLQQWRQALLIVQPDTVLRWHRELFRNLWRWRCRSQPHEPRIPPETITLIRKMADDNRLWGAERIRGELLKLGIRVSKQTVQRYIRDIHKPHRSGQSWSTFVRNHAHKIWACDFLQTYDVLFRAIFIFFIIELHSRRVVHVGVTRFPTDTWVAQQLREATAFGAQPKYLIRDNDGKYGIQFSKVAAVTGIEQVKTAIAAPKMNAVAERFIGSVRRECLDHVLILTESHLCRIVSEYVDYFNVARPHQALAQSPPCLNADPPFVSFKDGKIRAYPVLSGLHHDYQRIA